jgi:hypothetical protein
MTALHYFSDFSGTAGLGVTSQFPDAPFESRLARRGLLRQTWATALVPHFDSRTGDPLRQYRFADFSFPTSLRLFPLFWILVVVFGMAFSQIAYAQHLETAMLPIAADTVANPLIPNLVAGDSLAQDSPAVGSTSQQQSPDSMPPATARIDIGPPNKKQGKWTPDSEIAIEGMVSYGNWQIFAAGIDESLYTAGFEYDRNSWGHFAGAQMDYSADFMPLVLLKEPAALNPYGVRRSKKGDDTTIPGLAFSPIGLRMEWRHDKKFKPYFAVHGGAIGFTQKALSPDGSYYDFTLHESIGFYLRMTDRLDMRFGLFGDFHFSDAYITSFNPGLDVMNSQLALSYHLRSRQKSH